MNVSKFGSGILVSLILALPGGSIMADEGEVRRSLTVTGTGKVSAAPDVAEITIGVVSQAESARDALAANTEAMTAVQTLLKDRGVAEKDIQTVSISIQPRYSQPPPPRPGQAGVEFVPRIVGYEVNNAVRITARDIKKLGSILDAVVQSGANRIDGIGFRIDEPQKLEDLARKAAVADAKRKASQLAGELGVVVGLPIRVSEAGSMPVPQPMFRGRAMAMEAMAAPVPVAAGEQDLVVQVTVEFELLPAK
ncbi:MAG: hypothetical protein KatS3mg108_2210 [Isosphaeraceae bacterium]|jgi:uncharacterized protein YggE|nr:MAG: hypothetical protein KatS3mg108_2210 [Isosphaeraceae bacterium]